MLKLLTHWLVSHILETDMNMAKTVFAVRSGKTIHQAKVSASQEMNGAMKALIKSTARPELVER